MAGGVVADGVMAGGPAGSAVDGVAGVRDVGRVDVGFAVLGTVVLPPGGRDSVTTLNRVFGPAGFATPSTLPSESRRKAAVSAGTMPSGARPLCERPRS